MDNLLQQAGATPQKQPKYVPLFIDRAFTGIYKQRSILHDPSDYTTKSYGGRPDALWDGLNIELTNRLTLQRRPGLTAFSDATYPASPNRAFSFELTDGTIRIIIDTDGTGLLTVNSVGAECGGVAAYFGSFPDGGNDAYVGLSFQISGFTIGSNNGTFICTASTTSSLELANTNAVAEAVIGATAISAGGVYYDHQTGGIKTLLFAKSPGAGGTTFVSVAGVMYAGDGVDTWKYTPGNPNGEIWNWGIVAPTAPPVVTVVASGAAAVAWQASTWFSTMGILLDSNGNLQQLISVNNDGTNPTSQFGLSGTGGPQWNHVLGGVTVDGTVTWRTVGTLLPWASKVFYSNYAFATDTGSIVSTSIYDSQGANGRSTIFEQPTFHPASNAIYVMNSFNNLDQSDPHDFGKPAFNGVPGSTYREGSSTEITWICIGGLSLHQWSGGMPVVHYQFVVEYPNAPAPDQVAYLHAAEGAGTTDASSTHPHWSSDVGGFTPDNQLLWICLGSSVWSASTHYTAWSGANNTNFSCLQDTNGNLQVCIQTGSSGTLMPSWGTDYGSNTIDGTTKWVCVGSSSTWLAAKEFYLPKNGFSPPSASNPFGGAAIKDSNTNIQFTIDTGYSGALQPAWSTDIGGLTADNDIIWYNNGPFVENSLSWTQGIQYVFAYKTRRANDPFNTTPPPLWPNPLGNYQGAGTGAVSSASPPFIIATANAGAVVTLTGPGSLDPQVDTIEIYRTADGGSTFLFLTDIPNPSPVAGVAGTWTFQDYMPDTATDTLPGLNPLITAPINGVNDPPPDDFLPMVYNFQRIWGASGSTVLFSGGPDTLVGNPNEAFSASDSFPFLATVVRLVKTSQGLITFLTNSIEVIAGGPLTSSFYSVTLAPSIGLLNYDALDTYAGEIYFFSSDAQFKTLSPALNLSNSGFPLGEQFAEWDAAEVRVAVLQSGIDSCIFVADGSTGWYRVNPRQVPGGPTGLEPVWSPFAAITNGCQLVQSVETTPGIKRLLVGSASAGEKILQRNLAVYTDDGTQYAAYFVMGAITLAHPGQVAGLRFIEADFSGVAFKPTISFLLNEISGSFIPFTLDPQFDPPSVFGKTITPTSYSPNRYYFAGVQEVALCRHVQIKVDYGTNAVGSEMYNLTIFGRLFAE